MHRAQTLGILFSAACAHIAASVAAAAQTCETTRMSVDSGGGQGNDASIYPAISSDGRYVAFHSEASNLVPGDTNGYQDVFVLDRLSGATTRVSVDSGGGQANLDSHVGSAISSDGRFVAFQSWASNLVPGDTNGQQDVFVHDRLTGATTRVSVDSGGGQGNSSSTRPSISADGRTVAFESSASNLVPGDTNGWSDVFVHDRSSGATTRVSLDSLGGQGNDASERPAISSDGRTVSFESDASNLVPGDTNGKTDIFVHDRISGATTRVSVNSLGGQGNNWSTSPAISYDGLTVAFESWATNLVPSDTNDWGDVFVHDRTSGATTRVSRGWPGGQANGESRYPSISSDGRYVAFESSAFNLVPGDTNNYLDVFVRDRLAAETTRVSVDSGGGQGNDASGGFGFSISADGRTVAFDSWASNLVPGDTNNRIDVFVHQCQGGTTYCFGSGSGTPCPCGNLGPPGEGCVNSGGSGASLADSGSTSVSADDLGFDATHLRPGEPAWLFAGLNAINAGNGIVFGDGLLCAGGNVVRLGTMTPDAAGSASFGPGLGAMGGWSAGDVRRFQVWYRDPTGPCTSGFNLTNGVEVTLAP